MTTLTLKDLHEAYEMVTGKVWIESNDYEEWLEAKIETMDKKVEVANNMLQSSLQEILVDAFSNGHVHKYVCPEGHKTFLLGKEPFDSLECGTYDEDYFECSSESLHVGCITSMGDHDYLNNAHSYCLLDSEYKKLNDVLNNKRRERDEISSKKWASFHARQPDSQKYSPDNTPPNKMIISKSQYDQLLEMDK